MPELLFTHSKFYHLLFKYSLFPHDFLSKKSKLLSELLLKFIEMMLSMAESQYVDFNDLFFSLENLLPYLFESLISEEKRLDLYENLINQKIIEKFENLILEKHSTFALMFLQNFFNNFRQISPTLKEYFHDRSSETFERILDLNETILLKMNNIKYDLGYIIQIFLKNGNPSEEKYKQRLKIIYLTRYFLLKTNKGIDFKFEDILQNFQPKELFKISERKIDVDEKIALIKNSDYSNKRILDLLHKNLGTPTKFVDKEMKLFPSKEGFPFFEEERKNVIFENPKIFVSDSFSHEKIQEVLSKFADKSDKMFSPKEMFQTLERIVELNEANLMIYLEISRKIFLDTLRQKDFRKASILDTFFKQINLLLLIGNLHFFTTFKNDYYLGYYTERFANSIIRASLLLYNPLNISIIKGNPLSLSCINLAIQNPMIESLNPENSNLLIVHMIGLALEKTKKLFDQIMEFKNPNDYRLLSQFYNGGFLMMDFDLISEENYEKCGLMKQVEFLLILIKKFNRIQGKFITIPKFQALIENGLIILLEKVSQIFNIIMDIYLRNLIEKTWKIDNSSSFIDFISIKEEFHPTKCLKSLRILKSMFLFLKSFSYYRENNLIKEKGLKIQKILIDEGFKVLEINENIMNLDEFILKKTKYELLFLNLIKHNLHFQMWPLSKPYVDIPIIVKNADSLKLLRLMKENIKFYQKLLEKLKKETKFTNKKLEDEIVFILKRFYYKQVFMNSLNDLNMLTSNDNKWEIGFLEEKENQFELEEYFEANFSIFNVICLETEFSQFGFKEEKLMMFLQVFLLIIF